MAGEDGRQKLKLLLSDTVKLLCKSSLEFVSCMNIEGLIGITLDNRDVLLVSLRELISAEVSDAPSSVVLPTTTDVSNSSSPFTAAYPPKQMEHMSAAESVASTNSTSFCTDQQFYSQNAKKFAIGMLKSAASYRSQIARRKRRHCQSNVKQFSPWQNIGRTLDEQSQITNDNEDFQNNVDDYGLNNSKRMPADDNVIDLVVDETGSCLVTVKNEPFVVEDNLLSDADYSGNLPSHWQQSRSLSESRSSKPASAAFLHTDQQLNADTNDVRDLTPNVHAANRTAGSFVSFQEASNKCTICGQQTSTKSSLVEHVRRHSNIYKYYCVYCNKGFSATSNLRAHVTKHTGVREFRCSECSAEFLYNRDLKVHMKNWHNS